MAMPQIACMHSLLASFPRSLLRVGWAVLSPQPDSHAASLALTVEIADNYSRHRRNCVQSSLGRAGVKLFRVVVHL